MTLNFLTFFSCPKNSSCFSFKRTTLYCVVFLLWIAVEAASAQKRQPPNMILILTDDLGWSTFSAKMDDRLPDSRSDYHETPHIDKLVKQGMRFTRGYAPDPICTPSRRSIQFGQTSLHQDEDAFPERYVQRTQSAIPGTLKAIDKRYRMAHFGKWDLRANITPSQLGYDESDGDTGNKNGDFSSDREEKWLNEYLIDNPKQMDSITFRSIRFMGNQVKSRTPFYLQVSHYATHVNFEARQATYDKFKKKSKGKKDDNAVWAAMMYDLDASIGKLLKSVDSLGIADNTYIVLMADNGGVEFIPPVSNRLDHPSSFSKPMRNAPLRGGKWTLYEGGIRVPFIVRGPGVRGGSQSDVPVAGWDLLPTFAELAGNSHTLSDSIDGGSFAKVLKNGGKGKVVRRNEAFYFHRYNNSYPHSAIIAGDLKLIHFWKTNKVELYNIADDPGEIRDISVNDPANVKTLDTRLVSYIKQTNPGILKKWPGK
jgi:arylsulfatase A